MNGSWTSLPQLLTTAELAELERVKQQTIRKNYCIDGHHHGMVPIKLPNGGLRWRTSDVQALLDVEPVVPGSHDKPDTSRLSQQPPCGRNIESHLPFVADPYLMPFRNDEYLSLLSQYGCNSCGAKDTPTTIVRPNRPCDDASCFSLCESCRSYHDSLSKEDRIRWQEELAPKAMKQVLRAIFEGRTAFRKEG